MPFSARMRRLMRVDMRSSGAMYASICSLSTGSPGMKKPALSTNTRRKE
jgi:hypothetical protein